MIPILRYFQKKSGAILEVLDKYPPAKYSERRYVSASTKSLYEFNEIHHSWAMANDLFCITKVLFGERSWAEFSNVVVMTRSSAI